MECREAKKSATSHHIMEERAMDEVLVEIQASKNTMVDNKKMLRCVFVVSKAAVEENRQISLDISGIDSCQDDIETNYQVNV